MKRRIWIVAGEASGDARSAELMRAIRALDPEVEFVGAGGPKMRSMAAEPFDEWIAEAGVLGLWDVLKNYGYFKAKFDRMLADIARLKPDAVLLVVYPGFNLRLARTLRAGDARFDDMVGYMEWASEGLDHVFTRHGDEVRVTA